MKFALPIPKELQHLKIDERGYPIPYFVAYINDKPDFRIADPEKQKNCINYDKCWICGKKLTKGVYYFISGPVGLQNEVSTDTAMHKICAEFSLKACPHMYFEKADRREAGELYKELSEKHNFLVKSKPEYLFLIYADSYKIISHPTIEGAVLIRFKRKNVIPFHYEKGILTRLL